MHYKKNTSTVCQCDQCWDQRFIFLRSSLRYPRKSCTNHHLYNNNAWNYYIKSERCCQYFFWNHSPFCEKVFVIPHTHPLNFVTFFPVVSVIMTGTRYALFSVGSGWGSIWAQNVDISSAVGANPLGRPCCADPPRLARREGRNKWDLNVLVYNSTLSAFPVTYSK